MKSGWLSDNNIDELGILAEARIPLNDILINVTQTFHNIFFTLLAAVCILGAIMYILARWLGKNITTLSEAMGRFSSGDMDTVVTIHSNDEFSVLGNSFNEMTQNIRQLLETVRQKEKEKVELQIKLSAGTDQSTLFIQYTKYNKEPLLYTTSYKCGKTGQRFDGASAYQYG